MPTKEIRVASDEIKVDDVFVGYGVVTQVWKTYVVSDPATNVVAFTYDPESPDDNTPGLLILEDDGVKDWTVEREVEDPVTAYSEARRAVYDRLHHHHTHVYVEQLITDLINKYDAAKEAL